MARDTVILSPEYVNTGRREALALGVIPTGVFVSATEGGFLTTTAAAARQYISKENISTAQGLDYEYQINETLFAAALPAGCRVNVKAVDGTYNPGTLLEIGAGGLVTSFSAGAVVGVVPADGGEVISGGGSLMVDLL
mgnify:CR=1 FL=1